MINMQTFEQFMQLPVELHYYFLQRLPADRQVFAAAACATWYELMRQQISVDVHAIAMYGRVELLDWLRPGLSSAAAPAILHAAARLDRADLVQWANTHFPRYVEPAPGHWCELHGYVIRALNWGHAAAANEMLRRYDHIRDVNCHMNVWDFSDDGYAIFQLIHELTVDDMDLLDIIIRGKQVRAHVDAYIEYAIRADKHFVYEAITRAYDRYPLRLATRLRKSKYIKYAISMKPSILDLIVITAHKFDDWAIIEYMCELGYGDRVDAVQRTLRQLHGQ